MKNCAATEEILYQK